MLNEHKLRTKYKKGNRLTKVATNLLQETLNNIQLLAKLTARWLQL